MKRQMVAAAERAASVAAGAATAAGDWAERAQPPAGGLPGGLWIVRLRAPFGRDVYSSAASAALRLALRAELDGLFAAAARRCAGTSRAALRSAAAPG